MTNKINLYDSRDPDFFSNIALLKQKTWILFINHNSLKINLLGYKPKRLPAREVKIMSCKRVVHPVAGGMI